MRNFKSPDVVVTVLLSILTLAAVLWLGWSGSGGNWRLVGLSVVTAAFSGFQFFWWMMGSVLRLPAYRVYYRFFGPDCEITILGDIAVEPSAEESTQLDKVLGIAKQWSPAAQEALRVSNRSVIRAKSRTLTVDVASEYAGGYDESPDEDDEEIVSQRVQIDLGGYEGKLPRLDSLVDKEISSLLELFSLHLLKKDASPTFTLQAKLTGTNPFFVFYLRDVPAVAVDNFKLHLTEDQQGAQVFVTVTGSSVRVAARSPGALARSARRYLATPALAYAD